MAFELVSILSTMKMQLINQRNIHMRINYHTDSYKPIRTNIIFILYRKPLSGNINIPWWWFTTLQPTWTALAIKAYFLPIYTHGELDVRGRKHNMSIPYQEGAL